MSQCSGKPPALTTVLLLLPSAVVSSPVPELQGDPLEIAREKVLIASRQVRGPVLTEDTSLCFTALAGLPGPYVKHFLDRTGHQGLNNLLAAYEDKSAYAQCVFAYCEGEGAEPVLFDGRCPGRIVPARGPANFGWSARHTTPPHRAPRVRSGLEAAAMHCTVLWRV